MRLSAWGCAVVASVQVVAVATAIAADGRARAVSISCAYAKELRQADLIDEAQRTLSMLDRSAPGNRCDVGAAAGLRRLEGERADLFEQARTERRRLAAARSGVSVARRASWFDNAYHDYLAGLKIDPASGGARRGLRALLRLNRGRDGGTMIGHCRTARVLLARRLLAEARGEYVRAIAAGSDGCGDVAARLRDRRRAAYVSLRDGDAAERAGDRHAARASFLAALRVDPGLQAALDGLVRTAPVIPPVRKPPPKPTPTPKPTPAPGKTPVELVWDGGPKFSANAVFWVLLVGAAIMLAVNLAVGAARRVGRRLPRVGLLYRHVPGLRSLDLERLRLRTEGVMSQLQRDALQIAEADLRRGGAAGAGAAHVLIRQSSAPGAFAPSDVGGGFSAKLSRAVPFLDRLGQLRSAFGELSGANPLFVTVTAAGDDGFQLSDLVTSDNTRIGAARAVPLPAAAVGAAPDKVLGRRLASAIRAQRQGA